MYHVVSVTNRSAQLDWWGATVCTIVQVVGKPPRDREGASRRGREGGRGATSVDAAVGWISQGSAQLTRGKCAWAALPRHAGCWWIAPPSRAHVRACVRVCAMFTALRPNETMVCSDVIHIRVIFKCLDPLTNKVRITTVYTVIIITSAIHTIHTIHHPHHPPYSIKGGGAESDLGCGDGCHHLSWP